MASLSCMSGDTTQSAPSTATVTASNSGRASTVGLGGSGPMMARPSRSTTLTTTARSLAPAASVSRALRSRSSSSVTGASTLRAAFGELMPSSAALSQSEQLLGPRRLHAELLGQRRQQLGLGDAVLGAEANLLLQHLPRRRRQSEEGLGHALAGDGGGGEHRLLAARGDALQFIVGA